MTHRHRLPASFLSLTLALAGSASGQAFKISLTESGVYGIGHEDLVSAGLVGELESAALELSAGGRAAPVWIEDGGDGSFGPGDRLEFVGQRLTGDHGFHSEYSAHNIYWLTAAAGNPPRMTTVRGFEGERCFGTDEGIGVRRHSEENNLRVRFSSQSAQREDPWFWAKMTHVAAAPFSLPLRLEGLDSRSLRPVILRVRLRGWSSLPQALADELDHRVELLVDDHLIQQAEWDNGPDGKSIETRVPASALASTSTLSLRVPRRQPAGQADPLVDVVLVDWVEVEYPRTRHLAASRSSVWLAAEPVACTEFSSDGGDDLVLYGKDGRRQVAVSQSRPSSGGRHLVADPGTGHAYLVLDGALLSPDSIEKDTISDLRSVDRQVDYLMIAHSELRSAVEPLAEFHRQRGLSVLVVSVEDVFDEFNHGVAHPRAIRDFVRFASSTWPTPGPRFVLLVGDATWDVLRELPDDASYADRTYVGRVRFPKIPSSPYAEAAQHRDRNLVPTWSHGTLQGYAASDNWFVLLDDDPLPDMAIGRFPVATAEEVRAIVDKTIRYASDPDPGAWRSRVLLVTNEEEAQQRRSDRLAADLEREGLTAVKIYPQKSEETNRRQTRSLLDAFEDGHLVIHFSGHGGRFIWRTGPPDYRKNHDLFTLDHLDQLKPGHALPIVLSMTCFSAPFDHPGADSIGEKLLRLPDGGAVGVIAASWRNGASLQMSVPLLREVTRPGTLGEALMRAKHQAPLSDFVHLYNLLGDPALPIAVSAAPPDPDV